MISVIIPTYNRGELFFECLKSVCESIDSLDEIIVVNDFKNQLLDESRIRKIGTNIHVLNNPKQGVGSARNFGAHHAKGDVLLFIDDDMLINANAIKKCLETLQTNEKAFVNADWIYVPDEKEKLKATQFGRYLISINFTSLKGWNDNLQWKENTVIDAAGITSQFLMVFKKDFEALKGYNEDFPFAGFEDSEFYTRIRDSGFKAYIDTRCLIYHNEKDRINLNAFLERKYRGAITRKKAVELGFTEFQINYSSNKKRYYNTLIKMESTLKSVIGAIPNSEVFDSLYYRLVNQQVGLNIYKGYIQLKKSL